MRKSECGSGSLEVGSRDAEVGSRKWEVGMWKSELGRRNLECGKGKIEFREPTLRYSIFCGSAVRCSNHVKFLYKVSGRSPYLREEVD